MSKIICDVCGTRYPETAEACPICGRVRAGGGKTVADDIVMDEAQPAASGSYVKGGRFSKANVRKRNQGMVSYEEPEERPRPKAAPQEPADEIYGYSEMPQKQKSNVVLNVLLVIVIVALLCVSAYIFVEYFLPGILVQETAETTEPYVIATEAPITEPEITEEPTIPCTGLEWSDGDGSVVLEGLGNSWLLNVVVTPGDTTDELLFFSSDESVVTVDGEGRVTAVGEGEATVVVACGDVELRCEVVCDFVEETEAPEEATGDGTEETTGEETDETAGEEENDGPTEPLKDVTLEVNYTDITLTGHGQQFTFKVTGLSNSEVEWSSDDESVVTVDENGTVTRVGKGTANVTVSYGEQEVVIVVRCR